MRFTLSIVALSILTVFVGLPSEASSTRPLLPLPVGGRAQALPRATDPDHFTFVLSGDNRAAGRGIPAPPTAARIFDEIGLLQPAFTLWTGDTIYGSDDTMAEADGEYTDFLGQAASSSTPTFNAPGNHEIFDRKEMERLYEQRMGRLYGSFDYGHSHFIALDTEEIGVKGGIGKAQRDWLEHDLQANRNAGHIFVFMHHPLFPKDAHSGWTSTANRDEVHALFVRYGVKNVFSGHEHLYYKSVHDGVTYVVSGCGGAPTDAEPEDGGFQHFILFFVDGDSVKPVVLQPWRLFVSAGPTLPDGSCTALASNYNNQDLSVAIALPSRLAAEQASAAASWEYKGQTHTLEARIVESRRPGAVTVRVVVPAHRAALVSIRPK